MGCTIPSSWGIQHSQLGRTSTPRCHFIGAIYFKAIRIPFVPILQDHSLSTLLSHYADIKHFSLQTHSKNVVRFNLPISALYAKINL